MKTTKANTKTLRKLGFTKAETEEVVKHMNNLLANYHIHYQKLRNFHWNVKGKDFFDLHDQFEELYNETKVNIDDIAERIRVFGHTPVSTLSDYMEMSEIEEVGTDLKGEEMVQETLQDFTILLSFMIEVTDAASQIGDVGTIDLLNSFVEKTEKHHWMLTAWLNK